MPRLSIQPWLRLTLLGLLSALLWSSTTLARPTPALSRDIDRLSWPSDYRRRQEQQSHGQQQSHASPSIFRPGPGPNLSIIPNRPPIARPYQDLGDGYVAMDQGADPYEAAARRVEENRDLGYGSQSGSSRASSPDYAEANEPSRGPTPSSPRPGSPNAAGPASRPVSPGGAAPEAEPPTPPPRPPTPGSPGLSSAARGYVSNGAASDLAAGTSLASTLASFVIP